MFKDPPKKLSSDPYSRPYQLAMNSMLRLLAVPLRKYRVVDRDLVTGKYILAVFMNDDTVY